MIILLTGCSSSLKVANESKETYTVGPIVIDLYVGLNEGNAVYIINVTKSANDFGIKVVCNQNDNYELARYTLKENPETLIVDPKDLDECDNTDEYKIIVYSTTMFFESAITIISETLSVDEIREKDLIELG